MQVQCSINSQEENVVAKMLVTYFTVTAVDIGLIRCHDFSALTDWSPKPTTSCKPMHIHAVGYNMTTDEQKYFCYAFC